MKQIYTLIITLVLFSFAAQAQKDPAQTSTIIYHNNFTNGFGGMYSSDGQSLTRQASGGNASNSFLASGGAYGHTVPSNSSKERNLYTSSFSTSGFKDVQIIWAHGQTFRDGTYGVSRPRLYYSINGGAYKEVQGWQSNTTFDSYWRLVNGGNYITLPAEVANQSSVKFRWRVQNPTNGQDYYAFDDITIVGTPEEDPSTQENDMSVFDWNALPNRMSPFGKTYDVDGHLIKFTGTTNRSVNVAEAEVNNRFESSGKSLSIVQTNASSTLGTTVTIEFAEPVADLTFTLTDIDQNTGQFQDVIKIVGSGYSGQVTLAEQKTITTYNNSFNSTNSTITGTSGSDVDSPSSLSNVKVTFSEPVGRVSINYTNSDSNRGQQGIGIQNISWRRDRSLAPLPVELISFKAAAQSGAAKLIWATAMELNNEKFVVERSQDGKNFSAIGEVKGNGNSTVRINYSFTDTNPATGINYYRLRQTDYDGTQDYSKVAALSFTSQMIAGTTELAMVYPTVAASEVNVRTALDQAQVTVQDANGRQVAEYSNVSRQLVVPVSELQQGVYFVTVTDGTQRETKRFIKR